MSEQQWNGKSRGTPLGYRIFEIFLRITGLRFAYFNLTYVVLYFVIVCGKQRRVIWNYYRQIFGYGRLKSAWKVYLHFFRFGQTIVDKLAFQMQMSDKFEIEYDGIEAIEPLLKSGKGALFVGAHVGAWQAGVGFMNGYGGRMHVVLQDTEHEQLKRYVDVKNRQFSVIAVNKTEPLEMILQIKRTLDSGDFVCLQGDRYINDEHKIEAEFLGKKADFPEGPFLLAAKLRVPAIFYFAIRKGRKYQFRFRVFDDSAKRRMQPTDVLQAYVADLQEVIRNNPQMWFNLYDFWK